MTSRKILAEGGLSIAQTQQDGCYYARHGAANRRAGVCCSKATRLHPQLQRLYAILPGYAMVRLVLWLLREWLLEQPRGLRRYGIQLRPSVRQFGPKE